MNPRSVYTLADHPGVPFRYAGQATYLDDAGRQVEHDWVVMRAVGNDAEVWADPATARELTPEQAARMPQVEAGAA